jgi:cleavage and polyadenylation specificity factor subunit 5
MSIRLYPGSNYSSTGVADLEFPIDYSIKSHHDYWIAHGMKKTIRLLILCHSEGAPAVLFVKQSSNQARSFLEISLKPGQNEDEGIKKLMIRHLLKHSAGDSMQFSIIDLISVEYRPEFDKETFPFLPSYCSRPKEQIKTFLVEMPPRCVIKLPKHLSLEVVKFTEILDSPYPTILSKFDLKCMVVD